MKDETISYEAPGIERREAVRGLLTFGSQNGGHSFPWKHDWKN